MPTTTTGYAFANPHPSRDNYDTFNPQDVFADSKVRTTPIIEPIPAPWKTPAVMSLEDVLGAEAVQQIEKSGQILFHSAGDTGGIKEPSKQFAVADAMSAELNQKKTYADGKPAFFFHLGDVVYYFGQERYYYDQFYDPYRDYDGPIFAIPGNHDGVMYPQEPIKFSLEPFWNNFCAKKPAPHPMAQEVARTTMTQPGVYFTLNAPFIKIIGLYSNTSETAGVLSDPKIGHAQTDFLQAQLQETAQERKKGDQRGLIIATHHPPFTGSSQHYPSPAMLAEIDKQCQAAGVWPDLVLSGHAHLYERYTRTLKAAGRDIPYVVAGCGGYFNLSGFKRGFGGKAPKPGVVASDGKGNPLKLNYFNETTFGFLRLNADPNAIQCEFIGVNDKTGKTTVEDSFAVDLRKHSVKKAAAA